ncbi:MAG TPA: 30S ribosomal protein S2 [Nitrolancea sp.]|nr:30S ribosomal protein S2 [Nitrolancea sp.]
MKGTDVQTQEGQAVVSVSDYEATQVSMKALLEAGVHFGHQTKRWNPKMRPYIFTERHGIHIIDLQQTVRLLEEAQSFAEELAARGGRIVFVGTKKQAQETVRNEAQRSGMFFVDRRWLGGTLTNFVTIRSRLRYLKALEQQVSGGEIQALPKQEQLQKLSELEKLRQSLGGLSDMTQLPAALFIVDPKREAIAVQEARRLGIPIIAMTDTNCEPDLIDYVIPSNDDAIRAVRLITSRISDALIKGRTRLESAMAGEPGIGEEDQAGASYDIDDLLETGEEEEAPAEGIGAKPSKR